MAVERLRAAVVGVGSMGRNHARIYADLGDIDLAGIADPNQGTLDVLSERYHVRGFTSYTEMLDECTPDLVSVCVPTRLHHEVAMDAIGRGAHVLVEKPLAATLAEGEAIIDAARRAGVVLGVGHVERFNPVVTEIKRRLELAEMGRVFQIIIRRVGPLPGRITDVGVLLDIATHDIDILFYLTGGEVERVSAESARILDLAHEDLAVVLVRLTGGIVGVLIENWLSPTKIRDISVNCERGMFVADFLTQDLYLYENNYTSSDWDTLQVFRGVAEGNMTRFHIVREEPLRLEIEAFVESVRYGKPFLVTAEDGLRVMRLAEQLASGS